MGAIVVTAVAVAVMLFGAAVVMALRLVAVVRTLMATLAGARERLEPVVTELRENAEIASIEAAAVQDSVRALSDHRAGGPSGS